MADRTKKEPRRTIAVRLTAQELKDVRQIAHDLDVSSIDVLTAAVRIMIDERNRSILAAELHPQQNNEPAPLTE